MTVKAYQIWCNKPVCEFNTSIECIDYINQGGFKDYWFVLKFGNDKLKIFYAPKIKRLHCYIS